MEILEGGEVVFLASSISAEHVHYDIPVDSFGTQNGRTLLENSLNQGGSVDHIMNRARQCNGEDAMRCSVAEETSMDLLRRKGSVIILYLVCCKKSSNLATKEKRFPTRGTQYGNIATLRSPSALRRLDCPTMPLRIRVKHAVRISSTKTAKATAWVDALSQSPSISNAVE